LPEKILSLLELASEMISLIGVLVIVSGFLRAAVHYLKNFRFIDLDNNFQQFKTSLGRALMLGLEILVVADVIETITITPTFYSLLNLGILIILRTIVSWSLALEVEGHWPWQKRGSE